MSDNENPHLGSTFESFLKEEELLQQVTTNAIKRVRAWQVGHSEQEDCALAASGEDRIRD